MQKESKKIPEFNLEEGVEHSLELVKKLGGTFKEPKIVLIAGPSASGKTTQVDKIIEKLQNNLIVSKLSQDDYFTGRKPWDHPNSMDLELLEQHLKKLHEGKTIWKPNYSYPENRRTTYSVFFPGEVVIVEGVFALHKKIAKHADLRIYVSSMPYVMLMRRLLRDCGPKGRTKQPYGEVFRLFLEEVLPLSRVHVEPTQKNADFIILNNFSKEELERLRKLKIEISES